MQQVQPNHDWRFTSALQTTPKNPSFVPAAGVLTALALVAIAILTAKPPSV